MGKKATYDSQKEAWAQAGKWAKRIVKGSDGKYHAFESEDDYRKWKGENPTNYR